MMWANHAGQGAAGGLATLPWCPRQEPAYQAAWVLTWAGSALLIDIDTKKSAAARMWGPVSGLLTAPVRMLPGGHRGLTHDLILCPLLVYLLVTLAGQHHAGRLALVAVVIGLATRAVLVERSTFTTGIATLAVSAAGAWWVVEHNLDLGTGLVWAIIGGLLVHMAGDAVTVDRLPMPIAWIFGSRARIGIGLFRAGKGFEKYVVTPVTTLLIIWLTQIRFGWWTWLAPHLQQAAA